MGRANRIWFVTWGFALTTGLGFNVARQTPRCPTDTIPSRKQEITLQEKLLLIPLVIACGSLAVSVIFLGEPGLNPISVIHWTGSFGFAILAPWCILVLQILQITKGENLTLKNDGQKFIWTASKITAVINIILLVAAGLVTLITIATFGMNALGQIILTLACIVVLFLGNFVYCSSSIPHSLSPKTE